MINFYKNKYDKNILSIEKMETTKHQATTIEKTISIWHFLYSNRIIILINDKYLRDDKEQAGYKFNSRIKVIGIVNKLASEPRTDSVPASMTMDKIQIETLSLLRELGLSIEMIQASI